MCRRYTLVQDFLVTMGSSLYIIFTSIYFIALWGYGVTLSFNAFNLALCFVTCFLFRVTYSHVSMPCLPFRYWWVKGSPVDSRTVPLKCITDPAPLAQFCLNWRYHFRNLHLYIYLQSLHHLKHARKKLVMQIFVTTSVIQDETYWPISMKRNHYLFLIVCIRVATRK